MQVYNVDLILLSHEQGKDMMTSFISYSLVIKNFVCVTELSVVTVPFETSKPKSLSAFICTREQTLLNKVISIF